MGRLFRMIGESGVIPLKFEGEEVEKVRRV